MKTTLYYGLPNGTDGIKLYDNEPSFFTCLADVAELGAIGFILQDNDTLETIYEMELSAV